MSRNASFTLTRTLLLSAILMSLLASPACATLAGISLTGQGGKVNVIEEGDFNGTISYTVAILDGSSLSAFAVSNGGFVAEFSASEGEAISSIAAFGPSTDRLGWSAVELNESEWNSGFQVTGTSSGVSFNTQSIGIYDSLFGVDLVVSLYYHDLSPSGTAIAQGTDEIQEFHFVGGLPSSDFVALGSTGAVIDGSSVTAVPEPSAFLFLGLTSLGAFVVNQVRARRRNQQLAA